MKKILINENTWRSTIDGLAKRSDSYVESACVWAGSRGTKSCLVKEVVFLDDMKDVISRPLMHKVSRVALDVLFDLLKEKKLQLIADLHTHPESWVGLSALDKMNPMEFRNGFVSIIFPNYAQGLINLKSIGMHEYIGNNNWKTLSILKKMFMLKIYKDSHVFEDR